MNAQQETATVFIGTISAHGTVDKRENGKTTVRFGSGPMDVRTGTEVPRMSAAHEPDPIII